MAPPTPPMTPPMIAELLLLDCCVVSAASSAGLVGEIVTMAVETTMVTSVPVPIWEVYDVKLCEVIGDGLEVVTEDEDVVVVVVGVSELFSCQIMMTSVIHL